MKNDERFIMVVGIIGFFSAAVKLFFRIGDELSQQCWEDAFWGLVFFSGCLAISFYGIYLLTKSLRKKRVT